MAVRWGVATEQDRTPLLPLTPPSLTKQTTVVLCDYGGTVLSKRTRTSGAGRTGVRMTLDIKATPLLCNLNGQELGKGPSEAIRAILEQQSLNVTEVAKPATLAFRAKMARAYRGETSSGKSRLSRGEQVAVDRSLVLYAQQRYSGGRTGGRAPNTSVRIGVDSGRLARGWFVTQNPKEGAWTINVPANRFSMETWGGDAASLQAWIARYVQLIDALRDPRTILRDESFRRAVQSAPTVQKLTRSTWQRWRELIAAVGRSVALGQQIERTVGG